MTTSPSPSVGTTWVCIPTFNERENVRSLVQAVRDSLDGAGIDGHVLVIDDASPDGTGAIVDEMVAADSRVHVLHRAGKGGIGPAYIAGFRHCLTQGAARVVEMDCDFSHDPADLPRLIQATDSADLVIVATGMLGDAEKATHDPAYAAQIIDTTFTGTATITSALADILERQGHDTLVVISSAAGDRVRGDNHVYGAAKARLDGFAQGLALRLHGSGVHTLIVRPGFVRTRMSTHVKEASFANDADDVANDVIAALENGRTVVWSPGTLKFVMGILRHLPSAVFRRVAAGTL